MNDKSPRNPTVREIAGGELSVWLDESAGCLFIGCAAAPGLPVELFEQDVEDLRTALAELSRLRDRKDSDKAS